MPDVIVTLIPNGPYLVTGPVTMKDSTGREYTVDGEQLALCRCGHSSNKPFCDGTHKNIGFTDSAIA